MRTRISPEIELVFSQLLWVERRRSRIVESTGSHFGRPLVHGILRSTGLLPAPLEMEPEFRDILDDRDPDTFLEKLAFQVERHEAATVTTLREKVSPYKSHVDEQILFGSRTAGQEAARAFLSRSLSTHGARHALAVPEAVQALFEMNFTGLPGEKNHFLCLRPQGGATVHFTRSPHLEPWKDASGEPDFLHELRCQWIRGVLDILSPQTEYSPAHSIERGSLYGLEHFFLRGRHAGP